MSELRLSMTDDYGDKIEFSAGWPAHPGVLFATFEDDDEIVQMALSAGKREELTRLYFEACRAADGEPAAMEAPGQPGAAGETEAGQ